MKTIITSKKISIENAVKILNLYKGEVEIKVSGNDADLDIQELKEIIETIEIERYGNY